MLRVQQNLGPHLELRVPPGGVELRLAPLLPLLQQRPHQRRLTALESGRVLAWICRVGGLGGGRRGWPRSASKGV